MLIHLHTATGSELDAAGKIHHKFRRAEESDDDYRLRLMGDDSSNGGPAFGEFKQAGQCSIKNGGISVRDYFAAKAMQSAQSDPVVMIMLGPKPHVDKVAEYAYSVADAMLAERSK